MFWNGVDFLAVYRQFIRKISKLIFDHFYPISTNCKFLACRYNISILKSAKSHTSNTSLQLFAVALNIERFIPRPMLNESSSG